MATAPLKIATRESALALWQARFVQKQLATVGIESELLPMTTRGDQILDRPLQKIGGKGLFIKELEVALLDGRADIAAHSMKDLPAELAEPFQLAAVCPGADSRDALVSNLFESLNELPEGARVGTSSLRRQCQLLALRPDLQISPLRGNVNTRLKKLDEGEFDAIILACAGLDRLGLQQRISERIAVERMLPAVTQGIVGIEIRAGDEQTAAQLAHLHDKATARRAMAERTINAELGGNCQTPIAIHARQSTGSMQIDALVGSHDGRTILRASATGPQEEAEVLGKTVARDLFNQGAESLLARD
ncbi:MAG TPA: hydroxymethylbilane synthase [Gammaproteobacteria bacterium]|nr:hydroxymethylbilane synthase [Gammaproteobacteria bacterium]